MKIQSNVVAVAFLVGLCGNASLAMLTKAELEFSIFPLLAFGLAVVQLYQLYVQAPIEGETPLVSLGAFILGAVGYSALLRAQYPELGENFLLILLSLALLLWLMSKLGLFQARSKSPD